MASYSENKEKIETLINITANNNGIIKPTNDAYYLYIFMLADGNVTIEDLSLRIPKIETSLENIYSGEKIENLIDFNREVIFNIIGQSNTDLLDKDNLTDGKYINYTDGTIHTNELFTSTDYIPIIKGLKISVTGGTSGSQVAFYDKNFKFVSGDLCNTNDINIPNVDEIKYMRWCTAISLLYKASLKYAKLTNEITVEISGGNGLLKGFLKAYETNATKIIVHYGEYDVIKEYKAYYGDDYFDNYGSSGDTYNGRVNGYFDCGIWINNITVVFEAGASVIAHYDGDNSYVKRDFSAFAVGSNAIIEGLVLDASELRYGIHPDFHPSEMNERVIFRNCDLHHYKKSNSSNQAIGCGLGVHTLLIIENCIFRSDGKYPVWRFHNSYSSLAKSKVIMKDCYFIGEGYALFNSYNKSTLITDVLVNNCSWVTAPKVGKETTDSNENVSMIAWNNETRVS